MAGASVGVDTVAVVIPNVEWILAEGVAPPRRTVVPGGGTAYGARGWAVVEASLPKREYGHNVALLPVHDLFGACQRLVKDARDVFEFADPTSFRLNRIDLSTNFHVDVPVSPFLAGLALDARTSGMSIRLERSSGYTWESLYVARKSWLARLYDKFAESKRADAADVLRFEVELRKDALRSKSLLKLGDGFDPKDPEAWTTSLAEKIVQDRFESLGFSTEVVVTSDLLTAIHASDLKPELKAKLLYFQSCKERGLEPGFGRRARQYEQMLKPIRVASAQEAVRLDWASASSTAVTK